ncbi:hypothetical protein UA70_21620, partial [Raoultella planticola]
KRQPRQQRMIQRQTQAVLDYLPLETVLTALRNRPLQQTVIITGRGCHREIIELADTVSELRPVKHAFDAGIKAQMGIDY